MVLGSNRTNSKNTSTVILGMTKPPLASLVFVCLCWCLLAKAGGHNKSSLRELWSNLRSWHNGSHLPVTFICISVESSSLRFYLSVLFCFFSFGGAGFVYVTLAVIELKVGL